MPQDIKISFPTEDNNKQCSIVLDATQNVFDLISVLTRQLPLLDTIVYNKQELKPTQLESLGVVFAQAINDQGGLFNKPTINLDCTFKRPVHILLPKKNNPREITIYINPNTKVSELASLIADKTQIKLEQINLYDDLSASSVSSHALKPDTTVPNSKEPNKPLKLKLRQSRHVDKKDLHKALVNKIDTLDQIANQYQLWQHSYPSTFVEASQFSCDTLPTETIDTHLEEIRQDMNNCLSYIQNNNLTKLQQLINDNPYLINSQLDQNGNTALKAAAQHDKTGAILNWLIKKGAMIETKNIPGDSALIVAIKNGNKIGVETMLAAEQAEQKDIKELYLNRLLRENLTTQNYLTAMPSASKNLTTAINERARSARSWTCGCARARAHTCAFACQHLRLPTACLSHRICT